ncbi:hypothetical protein [Thermocatellispora tengchongensis]|uniref:hypothetical protein n=1 Tax=Thermocatellispora tengchongensis TaxID=1073253 RepID=UPI0036357494
MNEVQVNPNPVVVTGPAVKTTFTVLTTGAGRAELQIKPPGAGVYTKLDLTPQPHGQQTKWTATKDFGRSSKAGKWTYLAIAHGEGEASKTGEFTVKQVYDTRIARFDASPDRVRRGDTIVASGRLQIEDRHGWDGFGRQSVKITFRERGADAYRHVATVTTGRGGWFRIGVRAEATGWWRAEYAGGDDAKPSVSDGEHVRVIAPPSKADTRVSRFDAYREPAKYGRYLYFGGRLQVAEDWGWDGYESRVALLFKARGSHRWEYVKTVRTDDDGRFFTRAKAWQSGWWRAVYRGDSETHGSASKLDYVRVKR